MKFWIENFLRNLGLQGNVGLHKDNELIVNIELQNNEWVRSSIKKEEDNLFIDVYSSKSKTISKEKETSNEIKNTFPVLFKIWNKCIEEFDPNSFNTVLIKGDISYHFGLQPIEQLQNEEFTKLNKEQIELIQWIFPNQPTFNWIKLTENSLFLRFAYFAEEIIEQLIEKMEEDHTLEAEWDLQQGKLNIFYQEKEKEVKFKRTGLSCMFNFDNNIYIATQKEDIKGIIEFILEDMKSNKNINSKYFDVFCEEILYLGDKELLGKFHNLLLEKFTNKEIENYALNRLEAQGEDKEDSVYNNETKIILYLNHYFILDLKTKEIHSFPREEKKNAEKLFENITLKKEKDRINKKLKGLL